MDNYYQWCYPLSTEAFMRHEHQTFIKHQTFPMTEDSRFIQCSLVSLLDYIVSLVFFVIFCLVPIENSLIFCIIYWMDFTLFENKVFIIVCVQVQCIKTKDDCQFQFILGFGSFHSKSSVAETTFRDFSHYISLNLECIGDSFHFCMVDACLIELWTRVLWFTPNHMIGMSH